jgi:hypothetical protein
MAIVAALALFLIPSTERKGHGPHAVPCLDAARCMNFPPHWTQWGARSMLLKMMHRSWHCLLGEG